MKVKCDTRPESRLRLLPEIVSPDSIMPDNEYDGNVEIDIVPSSELFRAVPPLPAPVKSQPLSFFDNYVIEGGVPTFVFQTYGDEARQFGRVFSYSLDGARLALSKNKKHICVCDAVERSTFAEGDDLIVDDDCFIYVSFWGDSNEELVAITRLGKIAFLSISSVSVAQEFAVPLQEQQRKIVVKNLYRVDDSFREEDGWHFIAEVQGQELWLTEWTTEGTIAMRINKITKTSIESVRIYSGIRKQPSKVKISIPASAVLTMFLWKYEPQRNYTEFGGNINFSQRELYLDTIRIPGECIAQDRSGKYFLFWRYYDDGSSDLKLYSIKGLKSEAPRSTVFRPLGKGIFSVKATFLKRTDWPFDKLKHSDSEALPLACVLVVRSSGIVVLAWDSHFKKIIKEVDTNLKELHISQRSHIEFCVSPNLLWFAVGCLKDAVFGLFSFVSGVQVWSARLDLLHIPSPMFLPFKFDLDSSALIVNSKKGLFVCLPPCLVDDYKIEYQSMSFELSLEQEVSFRNLDSSYQRLISQRLLYSLFIVNFDLEDEIGKIAIASSKSSSRVVVVVYNEEQLRLVIASWENIFSFTFRDWLLTNITLGETTEGDMSELSEDFREIKINKETSQSFGAKANKCHVMISPNKDKIHDSIALFSLGQQGIKAIFIDLENNGLESLNLDQEEWFGCTQSKDKLKATCFRNDGILVIDLVNQMVLKKVHYEVGLLTILHTYRPERNLNPSKSSSKDLIRGRDLEFWASQVEKNFISPSISSNGNLILLGWDAQIGKPILMDPSTKKEESGLLNREVSNVMPCWALDKTLEKFAFLELNESNTKISAIGVYNKKDDICMKLDKSLWTPHMTRVLENMATSHLLTFDMRFDENTGYLWILSIVSKRGKGETLTLLPVGPYSTEGCVPCLYMQDYPSYRIVEERLNELESKFGCAFHDMPFNGMTNIHLSLIHQDVGMTGALLKNASENEIEIALTVLKHKDMDGFQNLLELAIKQKNESVVDEILKILGKQLTPFVSSAFATKKCFVRLWKEYNKPFEKMLKKDLLCREVSRIEVPSDVFTNDDYVSARVGTCMEIWPYNNSIDKEITSEYWRASHASTTKDIERKGNLTQVMALFMIFCIDDVCKVGLNGILRFLLANDAPSRTYKFQLVRWCITWKWEFIWKSRSKRSFLYYLFFVGIFSAYAILMGISGNKMHKDGDDRIVLTVFLIVSCLLALGMVPQEINQLLTYTKDGKELFPDDRFWGVRYYLSSRWNIVDLLTYIILLFVICPLHLCTFYYPSCVPYLYGIIAFESVFIWIKIWDYAQAFTETGALVLMIENVIRDCVFFLILSGIVLVAFSIALFILFQYSMRHHDNSEQEDSPMNELVIMKNEDKDEDETVEKTELSFTRADKVLLTLFYAMIGTLDMDVYSKSGDLSPLIIFIFVLYLSIQAIVMFNMLIAIMSDTYDRVKSTEEEQLLMGRARFIDACEAGLTKKQINKMESDIGKYLYVIVPKDDDLSDEMTLWQGRVKAIEDNVRKIVTESQMSIMNNLERDIKLLEGTLERQINTLDDEMKKDMTNLKSEVKKEVTNIKEKMKENITALEDGVRREMGTLQKKMNSDVEELKAYMTGDIGNLKDSMRGDMTNLHGNMKEDTNDLQKTMQDDISKLKDDMRSLFSMVENQIRAENLNTTQQLNTIIEHLTGGVSRQPSTATLFEDLD
eukprot:g1006.t1